MKKALKRVVVGAAAAAAVVMVARLVRKNKEK
jgi:hypothetical protein